MSDQSVDPRANAARNPRRMNLLEIWGDPTNAPFTDEELQDLQRWSEALNRPAPEHHRPPKGTDMFHITGIVVAPGNHDLTAAPPRAERWDNSPSLTSAHIPLVTTAWV